MLRAKKNGVLPLMQIGSLPILVSVPVPEFLAESPIHEVELGAEQEVDAMTPEMQEQPESVTPEVEQILPQDSSEAEVQKTQSSTQEVQETTPTSVQEVQIPSSTEHNITDETQVLALEGHTELKSSTQELTSTPEVLEQPGQEAREPTGSDTQEVQELTGSTIQEAMIAAGVLPRSEPATPAPSGVQSTVPVTSSASPRKVILGVGSGLPGTPGTQESAAEKLKFLFTQLQVRSLKTVSTKRRFFFPEKKSVGSFGCTSREK